MVLIPAGETPAGETPAGEMPVGAATDVPMREHAPATTSESNEVDRTQAAERARAMIMGVLSTAVNQRNTPQASTVLASTRARAPRVPLPANLLPLCRDQDGRFIGRHPHHPERLRHHHTASADRDAIVTRFDRQWPVGAKPAEAATTATTTTARTATTAATPARTCVRSRRSRRSRRSCQQSRLIGRAPARIRRSARLCRTRIKARRKTGVVHRS